MLFELYRDYSSVTSEAREAWWTFGLVALAGLVALWLIQLPLALGLARRLRRGQEEREQLLIRAIDASDAERRRIASDLHDGVVQDLAGLSFSLAAAADRATARGAVESSEILDRAAASARRAVRQMRSLLVDIYPPNLHTVGLESALRDLLSPLQAQGIESKLEVSPDLRLAPATERLLFVTAREAIRNVARHADAHAANVRVATDGTRVELVVDDDGRGFPAEEVLAKGPNGHLGLALLSDLAERAGGDLAVESKRRRGHAPHARSAERVIRVMLVDDHPVLREGLREFLAGHDDLEVVGAAADGAEAGRMAAVARPDVVLMDLRMPGHDGVAGTIAVHARGADGEGDGADGAVRRRPHHPRARVGRGRLPAQGRARAGRGRRRARARWPASAIRRRRSRSWASAAASCCRSATSSCCA